MVKPYAKGRRSRRFRLNPIVVSALADMAEHEGLGPDELLFTLIG